MSKIFDETYTRLDDDVSFQLVRTNPMLTTNTKLVYDGENMYLESYDANPLLVTQKYKNVKINGKSPFNRDIRNFLLGTKESAYDIYHNESDLVVADTYDRQFETMYWCGAESIYSEQYKQELGFVAPLYIRKKLPSYFVIFRVDGPSNFNLKINRENQTIDNVFDINEDVIKKARIIKTFSLKEGTPIGNYLKKYVEQSSFDYDKSVYVNFSKSEITYFGIDKKYGVLTSKTESFRHELLENDNTIMHSDDWITSGFKRNNLIFPYIINFEFLFDDNETKDYRFSRYFGLYCNDIDICEFEAKYKKYDFVVDKPEELLKETILKGGEYSKIQLLFDKNDEFNDGITEYMFDNDDKMSFHYIKDKYDSLHQVCSIYDNRYDNDDTRFIEIADKRFDLSSICGFEITSVSGSCERLNSVGKAEFSFRINKPFTQGEQIRFYYDDGSDSDPLFKSYTAVTEDEDEGNSDSESHIIPAGKFVGTKFSALGSLKDTTKALCDCINSSRDDEHYFEAIYDETTVVIRCVYSNENTNLLFDIEADDTLIDNKRIIMYGNTNRLEGGSDNKNCTFKIRKEDKAMFANGRYLKTGNKEKKNAKIISCVQYVNEKDKIEKDFLEISTDENGVYVDVANTGLVEIVDRFFPKFGVLSFFPVMDFDFDLIYSRYGDFTAFKEECERLEKESLSHYTDYGNSDEFERGNISSLTDGYFKDYNGKGIGTEYDYFMENLVPELSTESKSVPYIAKWGYYDDEKDSCENPYRLNMSKVFGTSNLSSNTFTPMYSIGEYTHSMPYYIKKDTLLCNDGKNYHYIHDNIGIYSEEYTGYSGLEIYEQFTQHCVELFMDTDVDNFEKLVCYKTDTNKRFTKKYSRFKFGGKDGFSSTLFRGVKFIVKKMKGYDEIKNSNYNDYKFTFLYIPVELPSLFVGNRVVFVKNDTFKFIVGFVVVNAVGAGSVESPSNVMRGPTYMNPQYHFEDFGKAYVYGGCYGLLSLPFQTNPNNQTITITNMPIYDTFGVRPILDEEFGFKKLDISKVGVSNMALKIMLDNIESLYPDNFETDASDNTINTHIRRVTIHDSHNYDVYTYTDIEYYNGLLYIYGPGSTVFGITDSESYYVDIELDNEFVDGEPLIFRDFYSVFETFSTYNIKGIINNDFSIYGTANEGNVLYYSTSDDPYKIKIEDPVSINTYDIFTSVPQIVPESGYSRPCCSDIKLKSNINDISLKTINRYSGYYNPIFNEIMFFDDYVSEGNLYKFSNTRIDTDYSDSYGTFGVIRNLWFHKVNEEHPNKIIKMMNPLYPAIGEFGLDYRDYNIFESNWDKDYFTTQVDTNKEERCPGTVATLNTKSMFGSKYMNVPEEITIDVLNKCTEWDDDLIMSNDRDVDVMFKEINGNTVNFYLFLNKRIMDYFMNESGLKEVFERYVNPQYSYSDKNTLEDDLKSYIEKNIMKLYYLDDLKMWVKSTKMGIHDRRIENDYETFMNQNNVVKLRRGFKKNKMFSVKKLTSDKFDRCVSYNLKTGYKEDFGFSFTIKKI